MKLFKKAAAFLLAAALSLGSVTTAFAEAPFEIVGIEQSVTEGSEESGGDTGESGEETGGDAQDPGESQDPGGLDISDKEYEPIDVTGYTKWTGKDKPAANTNYYIDGRVKIAKDQTVTFPEDSRLVLCEGANLQIYLGGKLQIRGNMVVEPKAKMTVSGTFSVMADSGFENYGSITSTKSSVTNISSEFIARDKSTSIFGGKINVYKNGVYINYGKTTLSKGSETRVTGEWQTPDGGQMFIKGYFAVTLSGRATQAGYLSLSGELINSGVLIFEKTVQYYKTKGARFAVSKSSRLIDYRRDFATGTGGGDKNTTDSGAKGIDVSSWQGIIDWYAVKMSGVEFAMIRSSFSDDTVDKTFEYNVTQAAEAGVHVGVYHYCYATSVAEAKREARFFIKTISPYKIDFPVVLDFEDPSQSKLGKNKLTSIAKAFLDELRDAGYYGMIYSYKLWLTDNVDMSSLSEYDVWLAEWNSVPTYDGKYGMWQYSSKGIVSGIEGYVDLDLCYKDYSKIIEEGGYNRLDDK